MCIANIDVLVLVFSLYEKKHQWGAERTGKPLASKDEKIMKVGKVWNNGGWWYVYCHVIPILSLYWLISLINT